MSFTALQNFSKNAYYSMEQGGVKLHGRLKNHGSTITSQLFGQTAYVEKINKFVDGWLHLAQHLYGTSPTLTDRIGVSKSANKLLTGISGFPDFKYWTALDPNGQLQWMTTMRREPMGFLSTTSFHASHFCEFAKLLIDCKLECLVNLNQKLGAYSFCDGRVTLGFRFFKDALVVIGSAIALAQVVHHVFKDEHGRWDQGRVHALLEGRFSDVMGEKEWLKVISNIFKVVMGVMLCYTCPFSVPFFLVGTVIGLCNLYKATMDVGQESERENSLHEQVRQSIAKSPECGISHQEYLAYLRAHNA